MRHRSTVWWCCAAVVWTRVAGGQVADAGTGQTFAARVGIAESGRLDQTASPSRFAGRGVEFGVGWSRTFAPFTIAATLGGGARFLSPLEGAPSADERLTEGTLDVLLLRRVNASTPALREFRAGIAFFTGASVTEHTYPTVETLRSDYLFVSASLGPAAAWNHAIAGGTLSADIGVPLVALVDHPYTDIREQRAPVSVRFVSAESYRGVRGGVAFTSSLSRTVGIVYAYRIGLLHFDDEQPVHSVTQSLSVGLVSRLNDGRRAR